MGGGGGWARRSQALVFFWVGGPEGHELCATNCRSVIMSH